MVCRILPDPSTATNRASLRRDLDKAMPALNSAIEAHDGNYLRGIGLRYIIYDCQYLYLIYYQ